MTSEWVAQANSQRCNPYYYNSSMAQNGLLSKRKTNPENKDEIFFLPLQLWISSIHIIDCYLRELSAQRLTQHCGHVEEEAENMILALEESLSWHGVENNLILQSLLQIQDFVSLWSRKRTILSLKSKNVMNILLSKRQFIFPNITCCVASTSNCSVFVPQICTRELLDLFSPFLLPTKYFFLLPGVMWNMGLLDFSEIRYNGMSASKVTTLLFIHTFLEKLSDFGLV